MTASHTAALLAAFLVGWFAGRCYQHWEDKQ